MVVADFFDGRSTRARRVRLFLDSRLLRVVGDGVDRNVPLSDVKIGERLGSAPRVLQIAGGGHCEVRDHEAFELELQRAGIAEAIVDGMQRRWTWALGSAVAFVALILGGYSWGLPRAAIVLAEHLPPQVAQALSRETLEFLDQQHLEASRLPVEARQRLERQFAALKMPDGAEVSRVLLFRSGAEFGPNAFTLPDGSIIVLDELVQFADQEEQVLAVLAHELGHARHRHGLRLLIQGSVVAAFATWWLGDVSNLLAGAPIVLATARYSRDLEREADAYAAAVLRANGRSPARLAEILEKLAAWQRRERGHESDTLDYASSHPPTPERIQALNAASPAR